MANIGAAVLAPSRPTLDKLQDCMATSLIRVFGIEGVSLLAMPFLSQEDNRECIYSPLPLSLSDIISILIIFDVVEILYGPSRSPVTIKWSLTCLISNPTF